MNYHQNPRAWTNEELKRIDRMREIVDSLIYQNVRDIDLIFELLSFEYLFERCSQRMPLLRIKTTHYRELTQKAAKEKVWQQIYELINGIQTELNLLRASKERGGTSDQ